MTSSRRVRKIFVLGATFFRSGQGWLYLSIDTYLRNLWATTPLDNGGLNIKTSVFITLQKVPTDDMQSVWSAQLGYWILIQNLLECCLGNSKYIFLVIVHVLRTVKAPKLNHEGPQTERYHENTNLIKHLQTWKLEQKHIQRSQSSSVPDLVLTNRTLKVSKTSLDIFFKCLLLNKLQKFDELRH